MKKYKGLHVLSLLWGVKSIAEEMYWKFVKPIRKEDYGKWLEMVYICSSCGYKIRVDEVKTRGTVEDFKRAFPEKCGGCNRKNKFHPGDKNASS